MTIAQHLPVTNVTGTSATLQMTAPSADGVVRRVNSSSATNLPQVLSAKRRVIKATASRPFDVLEVTTTYEVPNVHATLGYKYVTTSVYKDQIPMVGQTSTELNTAIAQHQLMHLQYRMNAAAVPADVTGGKYASGIGQDLSLGAL